MRKPSWEMSEVVKMENDAEAIDGSAEPMEVLQSILKGMKRLKDDLRTLFSGIEPGDAQRHKEQLHQLQD